MLQKNLAQAGATCTPNPQSSKSSNLHRPRRRACSSCRVRQYSDLSTDEMKYLSKLKVALQKVNWKLCHNIIKTHHRATLKETGKSPHTTHRRSHSRQKCFSLLTWLFGWGVYMNTRNIRKIKQNLQILQNQNDMQENQILELANYLNLTMIQVWEHCVVLHKLYTNLLVFNNISKNHGSYEISVIHDYSCYWYSCNGNQIDLRYL